MTNRSLKHYYHSTPQERGLLYKTLNVFVTKKFQAMKGPGEYDEALCKLTQFS